MCVVVQGARSWTFHMGVVRLEGSGWRGPCHGGGGDGGRSAETGVICTVQRLEAVVIGKRVVGRVVADIALIE